LAEIGFYQLLSTPLERALPKILERGRALGYPIVVRAGSAERVAQLDSVLWTYEEASFLPHGTVRDGNAAAQPIWLTERDDNPNQATMLVLIDGLEAVDLSTFVRCADIFDGSDESAVEAARGRWRRAREAGHNLTYWQQTATGWERRA
jgi:DNA polymerase III subunit chi